MIRTSLASLAAALFAAGCTLTVDPTEYAPKKAGDCAVGEKPCGYKCVPTNDPETGCGELSCNPCPGGANAVAACGTDGQCGLACNVPYGDCDQQIATGCEKRLDVFDNCGSCGRSCVAPSLCEVPGFVCSPEVAASVGGVTTGLDYHAAQAAPFALVQTTSGGVLGRLMGSTFQIVATGLGYVSGLAIVDDTAWFGRSVGQSEVGYFGVLSPAPSGLLTYDAVAAVGPAVDLAQCAWGTLWIPGIGSPARFMPMALPSGADLPFGPQVTAVAAERTWNRFYVADSSSGGTIWESVGDPAMGGAWNPIVTGAGQVGSLAPRYFSGTLTLYWTDLSRGDVNRYQAVDGRRDRIFAGASPAAEMHIAVDGVGDPYWTNKSTGEVMAWKAYGIFPRAVHIVGRSTAPGRILVTTSATPMVYWADEVDAVIRGVKP